MIQGNDDKADWERVNKATGGPDNDYSNMGRCTGTTSMIHDPSPFRFNHTFISHLSPVHIPGSAGLFYS